MTATVTAPQVLVVDDDRAFGPAVTALLQKPHDAGVATPARGHAFRARLTNVARARLHTGRWSAALRSGTPAVADTRRRDQRQRGAQEVVLKDLK